MSFERRLLFSVVTAAFSVFAIELLLQSYYYFTAGDFLFRRTLPPIYAEDPVRCYGLLPNLDYVHHTNEFTTHIYTNALGLRTDASQRDFDVEKPSGTYRILMLGPSFAFGWGSDYEEIFPTLLEQRLRVPGKRVEVINLGTPGQGPEHQLCWVRKFGRAYDPDMVLMTAYGAPVPPMPFDCPDALECPVVEGGHLYTTPPTLQLRAIAWVKNSGLVFYGYYLYQVLTAEPKDENFGTELHAKTAGPVTEGDYEALANGYSRYMGFVREAVGSDTLVAFVYIPDAYIVHPDDASRWSHLKHVDPPRDRQRIRDEMRALHDRGIPIVDALPPEATNDSRERFYYWLDVHLTPAGNRVVAEVAGPFLQELIEQKLRESSPPASDSGSTDASVEP